MKDVLRCAEKQNKYDECDINSIYQYARGIEGKTLLQILQEANLTEEEIEWVRTKESDKGLPGKIIEENESTSIDNCCRNIRWSCRCNTN